MRCAHGKMMPALLWGPCYQPLGSSGEVCDHVRVDPKAHTWAYRCPAGKCPDVPRPR